VLRQLDDLVASTLRSVQVLEDKLTPTEVDFILGALHGAKKAGQTAGLDQLRTRLREMEKAASLIGQAMLRI
jgi:hypothetical protein